MNGTVTMPKFMEGVTPGPGYYEVPNPYVSAPTSPVNLLEMSRYAREKGKKLVDLTKDEVDMFKVS